MINFINLKEFEKFYTFDEFETCDEIDKLHKVNKLDKFDDNFEIKTKLTPAGAHRVDTRCNIVFNSRCNTHVSQLR